MKLKFDYLTKCLLLLMVAMGMSSLASAQRTITGTVTDGETGDPLIGANVLVIGTSVGTITDIDGTFTIQVPDGATELELTYTGFGAQRVTLGASNVVNIPLTAGALLDEIVVIGYGSVKKSDLTGSIVSVGEEDFNQGLVTSPDQLVQGKAAGVQIINNSGQPGGASTIRIRGNASIRSGNEPLFVLDGIPLSGGQTKPGLNAGDLGSTLAANPLTWLNPNDIASMQVLKDASATAIYGSRGANGVIIINTKKGQGGDPTISFGASLGASSLFNDYNVLSASEYRNALNDYGLTTGDYGDNVNAVDEITRTALVQNHNIGISGGTDAGSYRLSLAYLNQEGVVKSNGLERVSANFSGSYKFLESKRLRLDFNLIAARTNEDGPPVSSNSGFRGSLIGNALQWNPTSAIYNADGSPVVTPEFGEFTNPVALLEAYSDKSQTTDILATFSPSYQITDDLVYKFAYSVNSGSGTRRAQIASWINIQGAQGEGQAFVNQKNITTQVIQHTLNFNKALSSEFNLNAVAGYEYQKIDERETGIFGTGFLVERFDYTNILQAPLSANTSTFSVANPIQELQSYFGRAMFNISDKYLLTATVRADGSSKFGKNNRYGVFPSFAAAWNLSKESFLDGGLFNDLKLRAGWGQTGNQSFDAGASQERYFIANQTSDLANVANPDLKWETTTTTNVAVDFAILDYKVSGTVEYFIKETEDLLFQNNTIQPAPAAFFWENLAGTVQNSGVEITLNTELVNNENLRWDFGANAAFISNEFKDYDGGPIDYGQLFGQGISGATIHRLENGRALNEFYTRDFVEIGENGQAVYVDNEALFYVGNPNPDVVLGISSSVSSGKLSLGLNFNGSLGQDIYNNTKNTVTPIGNLGSRNIDASLVGVSPQEATSNAVKASSRFIEDGSYLKLANATLAYNIGDIGTFAKNARLYVTGNNLLVFTGYSGYDPEVNTVNTTANGLPSFGIEYIPYPTVRTITFGLNFAFR